MTKRTDERRIEQLVAGACRAVGAGSSVRSVTVVTGHRLGDDALTRLRTHETAGGVDVTMDGDGTVLVRRRDPTSTPHSRRH